MLNLSDNFAIIAISAIAVLIVVWGYNRAKPYGEIGILAWLQSLTLMTPWLVFFALLVMGIYINLIGVIFLLLVSASFYIYLGNLIRKKAQNKIDSQTINDIVQNNLEIKSEEPSSEEKTTSEEDKTKDSPNKVFSVNIGQMPKDLLTIPEEDVSQRER